MMTNNDEKYAVVSTVDVIKKTYIIPMSKLQELNTDAPVELVWASDSVVCGEVIPVIERFADEVLLSLEEMSWDQVKQHVAVWNDPEEQDLKLAVDNCLKKDYTDEVDY